jgi:ornithine cyclodeaminase
MKIFNLEQIKKSINITEDFEKLMNSQKSAFMGFSSGLYDVPSPMQFVLPEFKSDFHIKSGYKKGSKNLVIKIASGNPFGGNGVVFVFAADTGELKAIFHDEGFL